jgi:hypothetical protein
MTHAIARWGQRVVELKDKSQVQSTGLEPYARAFD